jgi:hypothetical protein
VADCVVVAAPPVCCVWVKGTGATGPGDEVLLLDREVDGDGDVKEEVDSLVVVVYVMHGPGPPTPAPAMVGRISKVNVGDLNTSVQRKELKPPPGNWISKQYGKADFVLVMCVSGPIAENLL